MDRTIKIYIHHNYSTKLFYTLFHNTKSVNKTDFDNYTEIKCKYNNTNLDLIFSKIYNNEVDGYHLIDWWTYYTECENNQNLEDYQIYQEINKITNNKLNWIVSILRAEKIHRDKKEPGQYNYPKPAVDLIEKICNNNIVITDNFFIKDISNKIKFSHVLTNTFFHWNSLIDIVWFYEFSKVYEKLNFDYELMYSVRNPKESRIKLLKELSKLNNKKILLQITNWKTRIAVLQDSDKSTQVQYLDKFDDYIKSIKKEYDNVVLNNIKDDWDFLDFSVLKNGFNRGLDYDLFFRYLSKAKVQILSESWSGFGYNYSTQYLSEKTLGYILAKIPFIPTSYYPILYIKKELDVKYPFENEIKKLDTNITLTVEFIKWFMNDFENNYLLLKEYITNVHDSYIKKIKHKNSFLDLFETEFNYTQSINKNKNIL